MRYALALLFALTACAAEPVLLPDASTPDAGPCAGACGAGTVCVAGACVAVDSGSPVDAPGADVGALDVDEDRPGVVDVGAMDAEGDGGAGDAPMMDLGAPDATVDSGPRDTASDASDAPDTGCAADLSSDLANCGTCGHRCPSAPPGVTMTCTHGACRVSMVVCTVGLGNCDGMDGNGCETTTLNNVNNCGIGGPVVAGMPASCGNRCPSNGGTPACNGGVCSIACNSGRGDCDRNASNGCETNTLTAVAHCGACGVSCGERPCVGGVCR